MVITHLIYSLETGGAETMLIDLANQQCVSEEVHIIILNSLYDIQLVNKFENGVILHFLKRKPHSKNPYYYLKLNYYLLQIRPDIIHCHNESIIRLIFPPYRKKTCRTIHSSDKTHITRISSKFARLISISSFVDNCLYDYTGLRSTIIYNGINCYSIKTREQLEYNKPFRIVQIGRFVYLKGHDILINALAQIQDLDIKLDFIGDGETKEEIEEMTKIQRLGNRVSFLGMKDRQYIYSHLYEYDLLVQPSRFEGFGLTITEAMAAKVPVLVSNTDGPMEIIGYGKYGHFFLSEDSQELANTIRAIYNKEILSDIEKSYEYVKSNFDIRLTGSRYFSVYSDIINTNKKKSLFKNHL